jgi:hypothetical protein
MTVHDNDVARYTPSLPEWAQEALSNSSKRCLENLLHYQVAPMPEWVEPEKPTDLSGLEKSGKLQSW